MVLRCSTCELAESCTVLTLTRSRGVYVGCSRHELAEPGEYNSARCLTKVLGRVFDFRSLQATVDARLSICKALRFSECEWIVAGSLGLEPILDLVQAYEDVVVRGDEAYVPGLSVRAEARGVVSSLARLARLAGLRPREGSSIRFGASIGDLRLRFVLDYPPMVDVETLYIRRHARPFTLLELYRSGFLGPTHLSEILGAVRARRNMVIVGPPGSGKTTLLNAVDLEVPRSVPRIYLDETLETVDTGYPKVTNASRFRELLRTLQRSVELVVIGEVIEKEHFKALNHAARSGLWVLATAHAKSVDDFAKRARDFGVDIAGFAVVVTWRRGMSRGVCEVGEV